MTREAEAIEQQQARAAQPAAQAPAAVPANGAQNGGAADYSAQWAEYYRSMGKVKEAEAIEAQMKQKVRCLHSNGQQDTVSSTPLVSGSTELCCPSCRWPIWKLLCWSSAR